MKISAGEFVFYKSLNGDLSIYKVQGVEYKVQGNGDAEYKLVQVNSDGNISKNSKRFDTTLRNKQGSIRLFRIWLQPGDKVKMNNVLSGNIQGVVEKFMVEQRSNKEYVNLIEVISNDNKQHLYTFDQAEKQLEIL